nr:AlpA family phage regulatory protein [Qipengyuania oceanensis]
MRHRVGHGHSTIYRRMAEGKFPRQMQVGGDAVA